MIALEPRMLFDGALGIDLGAKATALLHGDTSFDAGGDAPATPAAPEPQRTEAGKAAEKPAEKDKAAEAKAPGQESSPTDHIVSRDAGGEKDPVTGRTVSVDQASGDRVLARLADPAGPGRNEIVFIDTSVAGYETLLTGVKAEATIVLLDPARDGIDQITAFLSHEKNVDAIHLVSHGNAGLLQIGTSQVDVLSMATTYAERLAEIGEHLSEGADILVYGCEFGKGAMGNAAATELSWLTGADIASSTDLTGQSDLGGDWTLERGVGTIESELAFSEHAQQMFHGVFETLDWDTADWTAAFSTVTGTASQSFATGTGNVTVTLTLRDGAGAVVTGTNPFSATNQPDDNTYNDGNTAEQALLLFVKANGFANSNYYIDVQLSFSQPGGVSNVSFSLFDVDTGGAGGFVDRVTATAVNGSGTINPSTIAGDPTGTPTWTAVGNVITGNVGATNAGAGAEDGTAVVTFNQAGITQVNLRYQNLAVANQQAIALHDISFNRDPVNTVPTAQYAMENTAQPIGGISVDDTDNNLQTARVTVASGTLNVSLAGGATISAGANNSTTLTLSGTEAQINAALATLAYTGNANFTGADTLTVLSTDTNGRTDSDAVAITVVPETILDLNSTPASTPTPVTATSDLVSNGTFGSLTNWTEGGDVADGAINTNRYAWTGASGTAGNLTATLTQALTVPAGSSSTTYAINATTLTQTTVVTANAITSIALDLVWQNTDTTSPHDNIVTVSYGGTVYATFTTGGAAGANGTWTYQNGASGTATTVAGAGAGVGTAAMTNNVITLGTPLSASSNLVFTFANGPSGSGGSDDVAIDNVVVTNTQTTTTTVTAVDLANNGWSATYTENGTPVSIADTDSSVFDANSANLSGATVTLTNQQTGDRLLVNGSALASGSIGTISWTRTDTVVTLSGAATKAQYADALEQVQFENTGNAPAAVQRVVNVTVTDGAGTSNIAVATIDVTAVNDAPVLADTALTLTVAEDAGAPVGAVGSLVSAYTGGVTEPDGGATRGIAITASNETNGTWYYSTNGGTNWTAVGTVSTAQSLLLADNANTRLYFAPAANYNGTATSALTVRAWDQTSGAAATKVSTATTGGTTAFSSATDVIDVTVSPVNDAPVLADTALTITVGEDAGIPSGAVGSALSAFTGGISDVDSAAAKGVAIVASNETNGTWYYSVNGGTNWTAVGTVSAAQSLLLADNANTRLYFAPAADYNGSATSALTIRAWDQTSGSAGTKVSTASTGGITAFSSATDVIDVSVTPANDAPVLADTALTLTIAEDAGAPVGAVGALVSAYTGGITDVDSGAVKGIAITASNETNGTWYYSVNGGTNWIAVGTVSTAQSLLLADNANTRLYFAPGANYNGTSSSALTIRAWDQSSGAAGSKVSTATTGGITAFSAATDVVDVSVTPVNDAPVLADTALTLTVAEDAGAPVGAVGSLVSAYTGGVTEPDGGATRGIAITASNETNGTWYYSTNGGTNWTAVGTVSTAQSLLLADDANTRLYFAPSANYNGSSAAALTIRAWDQTSGTAATKVSTATTGGITAFSSATDVIDVTVSPVNDAPVLADTALTLTVAEDAGAPVGAVGSLLSAYTGGITEPDGGATRGIAITASNETNGTWYYSVNGGTNWTAVGTVSTAQSLLLADNANTRLYFAPSANYNGSSTSALTIRAWDQTSGAAGTKVSTATTGGITAFSAATDVIDVSVTAVNDAPTLADTVLTLGAVNEDAGAPSGAVGTLVSTLVGGQADVDASPSQGIAVTAADTANGTWYYSINGGTSWNALGAVAGNSARLLAADANTRVYFQPNANYNGTLATGITFRAWDQTSGSNGATADTTTNGGATAFSTATDTAAITVNPINDAPVLADTALTLTVAEDAGAPVGAVGSLVSAYTGGITEPDGGATRGIAIVGSNETNGTWYYSVNGGTNWTAVGTVDAANSLLLADNANTRLYFAPGANYNGTSASALTVRAWDQTSGTAATKVSTATTGGITAFSSATDVIDVTVSPVNDAPVLADTALTLTVAEDAGVPSGAVGSLLSAYTGGITEPDGGATRGIAIVGSNETNGTWYYSVNGGTNWTAVGTVSTAQSLLLADNANTRLYFAPSANYNGSSTSALTIRAWDQTSGAAATKVSTATTGGITAFSAATDVIDVSVTAVNDAPTLADTVLALGAVNEDAGAPSGAVGTLVSTLVGGQADVDSGASQGIAITATDSTNGTWYYSINGGTSWNALGAVAGNSARLLAADANTRVYFQPNADYNGTVATGITFRAWDQTSGSNGATADTTTNGGTTAFSTATDTAAITVNAVNDAPVLADTALTLTVAEDAGAPSGAVGSLVSAYTGGITEPDGGATRGIAITASNETNGTWYYSTNAGASWTAVGTVNAASSLLLADNANTRLYFAPNANYNGSSTSALTIRAWDQTSGAAGAKVSTAATGGSTAFSTATDVIDVSVTAVNDAPTLADTVLTLGAVNEDAGAPSGAVGTLVSTLVGGQADVDSGASQGIAITASDTANGTWYYSTNGGTSWNALGAVANNNARLLAADANTRVYFQPTANYNGTVATGITFRSWDQTSGSNGGTADASTNGGTTAFSSATDTAAITVNAVNDAPVLADTALTLTVAEDAGVPSGAVGSLLSSYTGGITEPDGGATKGIAIVGSNETNGTWYYSTNAGASWTAVGTVNAANSLLLADNASTRLYFAPNANYNGSSTSALTIRAWDQSAGAAGTKVSTATTGGTTAFSTAPTSSTSRSPRSTTRRRSLTPSSRWAPSTKMPALPRARSARWSRLWSAARRMWIRAPRKASPLRRPTRPTAPGTTRSTAARAGTRSARWLETARGSSRRTRTRASTSSRTRTTTARSRPASPSAPGTRPAASNGATADTTTNGGATAFSTATDTAAITVNAVNDAPVLADTALVAERA